MSALADLMSEASNEMAVSLSKIRKALTHDLSKGEGLEETLRAFLERHLPGGLGVTTGQIIDSKGARSRQTDVIVYDANRTPMLFTSDQGRHQLVPSEGVIAVIEVKASLTTSDAPDVVNNMLSVKALDKSAYYASNGPIEEGVNLYGTRLTVAPTMYFVFGFEGSPPGSVAARIAALQATRPPEQRVDCGCILGQGVLVNALQGGEFSGLPEPGSQLAGYPTDNALLLFYILTSRFVMQIQHRPIDMHKYIPTTFTF